MDSKHTVAIVGAGPAGLFAARELALSGVKVVLFNRDIKPGGLAEYGIYPDKHRLKSGLRRQFFQILDIPNISYYGNIQIGVGRDFSLEDLKNIGFSAILVAAGAQCNRRLDISGENLKGIYYAWEIVSNYNLLPPYSTEQYPIGKNVAIIGVGNVMTDVARYLITKLEVEEVTAIARRGPLEVKFYQTELAEIANNIDIDDFEKEIDRVSPIMRNIEQDPEKSRAFFQKACEDCQPTKSSTRLRMRFLYSPIKFLGNGSDRVKQIELIENTLQIKDGKVIPHALDGRLFWNIDTVILAVGSRVDDQLGLPIHDNEFLINSQPKYPIEGRSHEVLDKHASKSIEGIFVAGWSRLASYGLVGISGRDGVSCARAVKAYLLQQLNKGKNIIPFLEKQFIKLPKPVIRFSDVKRLMKVEEERARKLGLAEYKFSTNQEMLFAMELT